MLGNEISIAELDQQDTVNTCIRSHTSMLSSQPASLEPPIHAVTNSKHRDYGQ